MCSKQAHQHWATSQPHHLLLMIYLLSDYMGVLKGINVHHMCADVSGGQYRTSDTLELVQVSGWGGEA